MSRLLHNCLLLIAAAAGALTSCPLIAADPVAPEPFFRHADLGGLELSPSGRYLGTLIPVRGRVQLAVVDLETSKTAVVAAMDDGDIGGFSWVNDNRLVFWIQDLQAGLGEQRGGGLFAVNRDATDFRQLAPTVKQATSGNRWVYRYTALHSVLHDGSDDILVVSNQVNFQYPDIYRMNTMTGRKLLKSGDKPGDVVQWVADRKGTIRAATTVEKATTYRVYWRSDEDAKWTEIAKYAHSEPGFVPLGFDGDGTLYVSSRHGHDAAAIFKYDVEKRKVGEEVAAHPHADLYGPLRFDRRKDRIVGVAYDGERPGTAWFDDDWARLQKSVDTALPGRINVLSRGDAPRVLVYSYSDTDPGEWYLLDLAGGKLSLFGAQRKDIKPEAMPSRAPVRYAARDGLEIPAYLTLPKGREAKNLPLVLYVHGGPWARGGHWRWNAEAAYLASLGYAVLEPDFRGSTGWGWKLYHAGWKQWGLAMQDDLLDGVDYLAKQGTIDPKRVCIMGASYGGYAVMMGLARDPGRFRCGVNYVGVTDINLMFDVTWSDFAYSDYIKYSAKEMIGDPDKDAAQLKATSPLENAARIKAPVLMAYGVQDFRVPLIHGEKMRDALKAGGTEVDWVTYSEEGHGFLLEKNRFDFYGRVAKFLARHNPPD